MRLHPGLFVLACLPASALAQALPSIDFTKTLLNERHRIAYNADPMPGGDAWWRERLLDSDSRDDGPYQEVAATPAAFDPGLWNAAANRVWNPDAPVSDSALLHSLQWDLGFTKARPGREIVANAAASLPGYGDPLAAAAAIKAGVDEDIFTQALAIFGNAHSTVAAKFAVAAQILRDNAHSTVPERHERLDIRIDVLERFMALPARGALHADDASYLTTLLEGAIEARRVTRLSSQGLRELPTAYRIARVAAAYRDNEGYVTPPCTALGDRVAGVASADTASGSPMCFADAHDRGVYAWYNEAYRRQATAAREPAHHASALPALLALLAPFGALMDVLAAAEFTESLIADELVADGDLAGEDAVAYEDGLQALTCRAP